MQSERPKLVYINNSLNSLTPDFMVKSAWVSTALALILTLPSVGIFMGILQATGNLIAGVAVGFALHFVLLSLSVRISSVLSKLFED